MYVFKSRGMIIGGRRMDRNINRRKTYFVIAAPEEWTSSQKHFKLEANVTTTATATATTAPAPAPATSKRCEQPSIDVV